MALNTKGKISYGRGGAIDLEVGQDPHVPVDLGGKLNLGAELNGFSGSQGGALTVQSGSVQIGGTARSAATLLLAPEFFSEGGFSQFTIKGLADVRQGSQVLAPAVSVAPGTILSPVVEDAVVAFDAGDRVTGLITVQAPEGVRAPVSLTLQGVGAAGDASTVVIGRGAVIRTDALGSVTLSSPTISVQGSIIAPGGSITIAGNTDSGGTFGILTRALATVELSPTAFLSTAGEVLLTPDLTGRGNRTGQVLGGGRISVSGNLVAETGAVLDVSGASSTLDLAPAYSSFDAPAPGSLSGAVVVPTQVDSDGGAISLRGGQLLYTQATLLGGAGGPSAAGGSLTVSSGRFLAPGELLTPVESTLVVTQSNPAFATNLIPGSVIGHAVAGLHGNSVAGEGYFGASAFTTSGLDSLMLAGTVQFSGPVGIAARGELSVADRGVIIADQAVVLSAPHVSLGTAFQGPISPTQPVVPYTVGNAPFYFAPEHGGGSLTVEAGLIDIGNLTLNGIGQASFLAPGGDIRGDGTLNVAGQIYLQAGQIYPPTAATFTISASDYTAGGKTHSDAVTISGGVARQLPLSAGGTLNVYGSIIRQDGVLRAPIGTINLGWDGTGTAPIDAITGQGVAATQSLTLGTHSVTSVSGVDPLTGQGIIIPYGSNPTGTAWIDPAGTDITAGGVPTKSVNLSAAKLADLSGSLIDLRGGGDLLAFRFVSGTGGTQDILSSTGNYAVLPGYAANYTPFAPFNSLANDPGYVNSTLKTGDSIYLSASAGLAAGMYTLLPARYALLPGAFLVTPQAGLPVGNITLPDGSNLVTGYRINTLDAAREGHPLLTRFLVDSSSVLANRAQYEVSLASGFLRQGALANDSVVPRLPGDAGHLILSATEALTLNGKVSAGAAGTGQGGLVDISSPVDILISGAQAISGSAGKLVLNAASLSAFGADSLLIGGYRQGDAVTVRTGNLTVDNAGTPLTAPDLILVANNSLTLDAGAIVESKGTLSGAADALVLGDAAKPGSGDGAALRVSSDIGASLTRQSVNTTAPASLQVGAGATVSGTGVVLDSTSALGLGSNVHLQGRSLSLASGRMSLDLSGSATIPSTAGLVLTGSALRGLESAARVSLASYSTIDFYGAGEIGSTTLGSLALHAAALRAFDTGTGMVKVTAGHLLLDNSLNGLNPAAVAATAGTLSLNAGRITIGTHQLAVEGFAGLQMTAAQELLFQGTGGVTATGDVTVNTPVITGSKAATQHLVARGALTVNGGSSVAQVAGGLGASLTLQGATVDVGGAILLPSGSLTLHATQGDVTFSGSIDAGGTAKTFLDQVRYTDGGQVTLTSDTGAVTTTAASKINVAAQVGGGRGGSVAINAGKSSATVSGKLSGGSFSLDTGTQSDSSLASLSQTLDTGGFRDARSFRVRTGDVTIAGSTVVHTYNFSTDTGAITVTGTIDASASTGGSIALTAGGDLTLAATAGLNAGTALDHAGKGGAVSLETTGGTITLAGGSTVTGGSLLLRAPQIAGGTDVAVAPLAGDVTKAGHIIVEGFFVQDAMTAGTASIDSFESAASDNANAFMTHAAAIQARLGTAVEVRPGEVIANSAGGLVLNNDWDLSTWRYGASSAVMDDAGNPLFDANGNQIFTGMVPGNLTLRALGSITFNGALSDGFGTGAGVVDYPINSAGNPALWQQSLLPLLADGTAQNSWSYRVTAGADFAAADSRKVLPVGQLAAGQGSVVIGVPGGETAGAGGASAVASQAVDGHYQVIRTGTGDIVVQAAGDVTLFNQFATIYTAGKRVSDPTLGGTFDLPVLDASAGTSALGEFDPSLPPQYAFGGGNVTVSGQGSIQHLTMSNDGAVIADSERQLPVNWLYRRGFVATSGRFGKGHFGDVASTTWWVDYSNFFEGVGALGGGNVSLTAGLDISNVDAVIPTNARMPGKDSSGQAIAPNASTLVQDGGGDLAVRAGNNVDGGVYYVERGHGDISAGGSIVTNATRSPNRPIISSTTSVGAPETWLPTTLFVGDATIDVSARGDLLLGPAANPFLLPGGYNNTFWYKTYFSTFAPTSGVTADSLTGSITLREEATPPTSVTSTQIPILQYWLQKVSVLPATSSTISSSYFQPWLRLDETSVQPFGTLVSLNAPSLRATAFSGSIDLVGRLTLTPSASGTVELLAAGSVNGLQPNGQFLQGAQGVLTTSWGTGQINLSDTNPVFVPGADSPFAFQSTLAANIGPLAEHTGSTFLIPIDALFAETGATAGQAAVLQTKQALHGPGPLHAGDSQPVRLYALDGNISGLDLYAGKSARVVSGRDVTDVALYIQNDHPSDVSVISAARDIIAYDPSSPLRGAAQSSGNALNSGDLPTAGDLQISGPGTLEVLAGRELNLGVGPNAGDGTGLGLVSIGNARNPFLPFTGAQVVAAAGFGPSGGLTSSTLDFTSFIQTFLAPGSRTLTELEAKESSLSAVTSLGSLSPEQRDLAALEGFFLVLRDAGRDHNAVGSPGTGNYDAGLKAISTLFPSGSNTGMTGDISLTSREIKTQSGGNITILAPHGKLTVGLDLGTSQPVDQGILTENGGNIYIYTDGDVTVGTSRIFTLRGGDIAIWSSNGSIAAGSASKTVQSAPPTRVLIDPQSSDVSTDLAGLATGGGIGVLESVSGVAPGDVDLIAPKGTIDAGDAGIRVSGNLNLAAVQVLNASNIAVGGSSAGSPAAPVAAAPNLAGLASASSAGGAAANASAQVASQQTRDQTAADQADSIVTVEVIGYGGGDDSDANL